MSVIGGKSTILNPSTSTCLQDLKNQRHKIIYVLFIRLTIFFMFSKSFGEFLLPKRDNFYIWSCNFWKIEVLTSYRHTTINVIHLKPQTLLITREWEGMVTAIKCQLIFPFIFHFRSSPLNTNQQNYAHKIIAKLYGFCSITKRLTIKLRMLWNKNAEQFEEMTDE